MITASRIASVPQLPALPWIGLDAEPEPPFIVGYRRRVTMPQAGKLRFVIAADERYELYCDGELVGRGNDRGAPHHWFVEAREILLPAGTHCLAALVWTLGETYQPQAQMSVCHGFALADLPHGDGAVGTQEIQEWEALLLEGYSCTWNDWRAIGYGETYDFARYRGEAFVRGEALPGTQAPVAKIAAARPVQLTRLPEQINRRIPAGHFRSAPEWDALWRESRVVTIAPHQEIVLRCDLDDYYCGYAHLQMSGGAGAQVDIGWAEALCQGEAFFHAPKVRTVGGDGSFWSADNHFLLDGGRHDLVGRWWDSGVILQIKIKTGAEPLMVEGFFLQESRYPFEQECVLPDLGNSWREIMTISRRTWQMCAHETFMDCPYYEQLMYLGDTRVQLLITYVMTHDNALAIQALELMFAGQREDGLTMARYPSTPKQWIPPFSLMLIGSLRDYALYRQDRDSVLRLLPGARKIIAYFQARMEADNLVASQDWNFCDWSHAPGWQRGAPPEGADHRNAFLNFDLLAALHNLADLEARFGSAAAAHEYRQTAQRVAAALRRVFYDEETQMFADDSAHLHYSEHVQIFAILTGLADRWPEHAPQPLADTTVFFDHYFLEAMARINRVDLGLARLEKWEKMLLAHVRTTLEEPEPTRSDCHAWSAHWLYHAFALLWGARPAAPGFTAITIAPHDIVLDQAPVQMVHPNGMVVLAGRREPDDIHFYITLPSGVCGKLHWRGKTFELSPGNNKIGVKAEDAACVSAPIAV